MRVDLYVSVSSKCTCVYGVCVCVCVYVCACMCVWSCLSGYRLDWLPWLVLP